MSKIDEQFIKEKINPVVGFIFHTARQLGQDNAPASMDMQYLKQGTEKVCELLREASPTAPPEDAKALEDAKAFADSREDAEGSIGSVYAIMAAFLESKRPEIERKAVERFIKGLLWTKLFSKNQITAMRNVAKDAYGLEGEE